MKKLLIIFAVAMIAAGCNKTTQVPEQTNNQPAHTEENIPDAAKFTREEYEASIKDMPNIPGLPSDIYRTQVGKEVSIGNTKYLFILQGNSNYNIPIPDGENEKWAGILSSNGNGKTWKKFFTIKDPTVTEDGRTVTWRHNPLSITSVNGNIVIDLVDERGAGSGEGNLTRLSSINGTEWTKIGCFYYPGSEGGPIKEKSTECLYQP